VWSAAPVKRTAVTASGQPTAAGVLQAGAAPRRAGRGAAEEEAPPAAAAAAAAATTRGARRVTADAAAIRHAICEGRWRG
jgi:hypothetical protein